jgi:hypothetical protein
MGRRPKPIEGEIEALALLAADLRRLHHAAGNPPLRTMAMRARYSASTLSEAASGRRLPTLPVVLAYVSACGADPEGWEERWRRVAAAVHADNEPTATHRDPGAAEDRVPPKGSGFQKAAIGAAPGGAGDDPLPAGADAGQQPGADPGTAASDPDHHGRQERRAKTVRWVLGGTVLALALACHLTVLRPTSPAPAATRMGPGGPASSAPVPATGTASPRTITEDTDPQDTGCDKGQVDTAASARLYGPDRFFVGYIWLRYAPACQAMWPRFEPAAGLAELGGAKVSIQILRPSDGRTLRYDTPYLGAFVYGNMLQTSHGCLRAEATVTAPHPTQGPAAALPGTGLITAHAETQCVLPLI